MANLDHYYRVLGLTRPASQEELRLAYRDLAQVWHPDRFQGNSRLRDIATERLREINEAYHVLCRLEQRAPSTPSGGASQASTVRRPSFGRAARFYRAQTNRWLFSLPRFLPDSSWYAVLCFLVAIALVFTVLMACAYIYRAVHVPVANADFIVQDALRKAGVRTPELPSLNWPQIPRLFAVTLPDAPVVQPQPTPVNPRELQNQSPKSKKTSPGRKAALSLISNGAELIPVRKWTGAGRLRIANRTDVDAVAGFTTVQRPKTLIRMVYVRSANEVLLADIGPGSYLVTFQFGGGWLSGELHFADRRFSSGPFGPFTFWGIEDAHGVRSDHYDIVLKLQQGGLPAP